MNQPEHIKPILERVIESMLSQYDEPIAEGNVGEFSEGGKTICTSQKSI